MVPVPRPAPLDVLSVTFELHAGVTFVELAGPVCAYTAPYLDSQLGEVGPAAGHHVVVDASRVRTMSSDGLDVLVDHAARHQAAGGGFVLRDPSPITRRVLSLTDLDRLAEATPAAAAS